MFKYSLVPVLAAALLAGSVAANAQTAPPKGAAPMAGQSAPPGMNQQMGETPVPRSSGSMSGGSMGGGSMGSGSMGGSMKSDSDAKMGGSMGGSMKGGMFPGLKSGPDHGMPEGNMGEGESYTGAPDLQAAISLVTAGGAPGHFSLVAALTKLAGPKIAGAEVKKLTKQYGAAAVTSFVTVQNFAVNDAVKKALAAGVKFPAPKLHGAALAVQVVKDGLIDGTYYEGVQLDHLVTHDIHEAVMADIDAKFGTAADANYHRIANQAHYDLAQALGVKTVKLAAYH